MRIKQLLISDKPTMREIAEAAGLEQETFSRIVNGKQQPSFAEGRSAERIAKAMGWSGSVRELFEEVGE